MTKESLRTIRQTMCLTQGQFADLLGYKDKTISEMETGGLSIQPAFAIAVTAIFTLWEIQGALRRQEIILPH